MQTADPGTHHDSAAIAVEALGVQAGVGRRLHAGRDAVVHERIHAARFLGRQVGREIEAAHRAAEAHRETQWHRSA